MAKDEKKPISDVAKPGSTLPDSSSKPVIVSHSMIKDPMVSDTDKDPEDSAAKATDEKEKAPSEKPSTNRVIKPLESEKSETDEVDQEGGQDKPDDDQQPLNEQDDDDSSGAVVDAVVSQAADKNIKTKEVEAETKRRGDIDKLIESKKYFVKVKTSKGKRSKRALSIFILVALIGLVGVGIAADAGLLPFDVPFDFIKKTEPAVATAPTTQVGPVSEQTEPIKKTEDTLKASTYSLEVPSDWKMTQETGDQGGETIGKDIYTLPSGATLNVHYDLGGRGGMCEAEADDTPHATTGNICPTFEILSAEKIDISETTSKLIYGPPGKMWLIKTKFTGIDGKAKYSLNIETNFESESIFAEDETTIESYKYTHIDPKVNDPQMGAFREVSEIVTPKYYFWITVGGIDDASESFFENADVKSIYEVLKTFELKEK